MVHRSLFPGPIQRRLAPLAAAAFFGGIALWVPVEKLFLAELGFTPQTIGLMAAAYAAVVPIIIGIALQLKALADLLSLASVQRHIYERSMRWFMVGLVLTALGVVLAIFFDLTSISGGL